VSETPPSLPGFASWPTFPFEGDLHVKRLDDPVSQEPDRHGEDPAECRACRAPDEAYIWVSERWRVRSLDRPTGLPMVLILESRSHLDLGDLPNMLAAELGVMTVRLERAVRSLDGVARVHVNRWGDGSAHLHLWFLARPYGRLQLRGTFLSLWDEILPPIPEHQWRENLALVAAWLAEFGGRPLAEPPRIDWKAPAMFAVDSPAIAEDGADDADDETGTGSGGEDMGGGARAASDDTTNEPGPDSTGNGGRSGTNATGDGATAVRATGTGRAAVPGQTSIAEGPAQDDGAERAGDGTPTPRAGSASDRDSAAAAPA
jgi:hypothetical protein